MKRDMPKGTVLAFDFGLKRIGVAVGEPELRTVHPLPAVSQFTDIEGLVEEWKPASLVVGLPTSAQGEPPKMTRQAEDFARRLRPARPPRRSAPTPPIKDECGLVRPFCGAICP